MKGLKARHEDHVVALGDAYVEADGHSKDMEEGKDADHRGVRGLGVLDPGADLGDAGQDVAVAQHDPFGGSRRAAGVLKDGQVILGAGKMPQNFQWFITATQPSPDGKGRDRFAYLGFTHVWYNQRHDPEYNADRTFVIGTSEVDRAFAPLLPYLQYDDVRAALVKQIQSGAPAPR